MLIQLFYFNTMEIIFIQNKECKKKSIQSPTSPVSLEGVGYPLPSTHNCRDIGGSDPERTAAPRVEEYVKECFAGTNVQVT